MEAQKLSVEHALVGTGVDGSGVDLNGIPCTCSVAVPWSMANMLEPVHT